MESFTIVTVILGIVISIIALSYTKRTYEKDFVDKPNKEKLHLLAQFKATQKLSHQVYKDLYTYVEKHKAFDQFMWPGITYKSYLSEMQKSQNENLSDKLFEDLRSLDLPSLTIQSMNQSLSQQFESLTLIHQEVKLKLSAH